jgi:hypothetical protein
MKQGNIHVDYLCSQPGWKFRRERNADFCMHCKESIHKLDQKEPEEINALLKAHNNRMCGVFFEEQFIIDEHTHRSSPLYKLIIAGIISWFSASFRLNAQSEAGNPVKVEQHYLGNDSTISDPVIVQENIKTPECVKAETPVVKKKPVKYLRIGMRRIYVSGRFPFVHVRKIRRGRIATITPSF